MSNFAIGQSFSDNFDSYTAGAYLGVASSNWDTWSGTAGGADDVQIVNDQAYSGSNSIYFEASASTGGPDDVVLPFGGAYTTGNFNYTMSMLIDAGAGAYFNFQAETTVGQVWTLECTINQDGDFNIGNTDGTMLTGNIDISTWTELQFEIDLDLNEWDFIVDGTSEGTFSNTVNKIASLNIYAYNGTNGGNGVAKFWVDDVSYNYTSSTLPNLNGAVSAISPITGLVGQNKKPSVTVKNLGNTTITSFDVEVDYNGSQVSQSITGVSLLSYEEYTVDFTQGVALISGTTTLTATVSNVNGMATDDDATDDVKTTVVSPMLPGLNKMVVVEEGTGTWCGWCPRGTVWMERMQENYPDHFIGIAVHNGDPMTNADYDAGMGTLINGYPSALVDRTGDIDPAAMEPPFLEQVQLDATGALCHSAEFNNTTGEMTVKLHVTLLGSINSSWSVAMALTENDVTGTSTQYAQANYYSGGANGQLSGAGHDWHTAANPVPASQMEYDHVARVIAPSFNGLAGSFPTGGSASEEFDFEFVVPVSTDWNLDNMHVITMLLNDNGEFDNGFQSSYAEASEAVCTIDTTTGVNDAVQFSQTSLSVYPNPAQNNVNIKLNLKNDEQTTLVVRDVLGRVVYTTMIVDQIGLFELNLDLTKVNSGLYVVEARSESGASSSRFIKE